MAETVEQAVRARATAVVMAWRGAMMEGLKQSEEGEEDEGEVLLGTAREDRGRGPWLCIYKYLLQGSILVYLAAVKVAQALCIKRGVRGSSSALAGRRGRDPPKAILV